MPGRKTKNSTNMEENEGTILITKEDLDMVVAKAVKAAMDAASDSLQEIVNRKLSHIEESVDTLQTATGETADKLAYLQGKVDSQQSDSNDLIQSIRQLEAGHNDLEAWTRKSSVRIAGIPHHENEDCIQIFLDLFKNKMKVHIDTKDISVAHRMPRSQVERNQSLPPVILCNFVRIEDKSMFLKKKKALGGSHIWINEDMTKINADILRKLNADDSPVERAWAVNGKVLVKVCGITKITKKSSLSEILSATPSASYSVTVSGNINRDMASGNTNRDTSSNPAGNATLDTSSLPDEPESRSTNHGSGKEDETPST